MIEFLRLVFSKIKRGETLSSTIKFLIMWNDACSNNLTDWFELYNSWIEKYWTEIVDYSSATIK